jgi:CRP/FNR family transcriptional regulator
MSTVAQIGPQPGTVLLRQQALVGRPARRESVCANCNLRETCLSGGVPDEDLARVENIVFARRLIKRGEHLFDAGDEFKSVYAIRSGFFKTILPDSAGRGQVTGFFMGGELLGMDGLGSNRYGNSAIALEDSNVCAMPYALIEEISREVPSLQRRLHSVLSREIVRGHGIMMLLGSMSSSERLATFLLNLSRRYERRGYSESHFVLRMSREEIGSYLGLQLETVSRVFSAFHQRGLIEVQLRQVAIIDVKGLERVLTAGD